MKGKRVMGEGVKKLESRREAPESRPESGDGRWETLWIALELFVF